MLCVLKLFQGRPKAILVAALLAGLIGLTFIIKSSATEAADSPHPNTVTTLGTLHVYMLKNPQYTLKDLIAAIETYKPDLILNEVKS